MRLIFHKPTRFERLLDYLLACAIGISLAFAIVWGLTS
jgi:hypothetical protein